MPSPAHTSDAPRLPGGCLLALALLLLATGMLPGDNRQSLAATGDVQLISLVTRAQPVSANTGHLKAADCASCHALNHDRSHPTDITPTFAIPAGYPLEYGKVTCLTCHQDTIAAHQRATETNGYMLRADATILCFACHQTTALDRKSQHVSAVGQAHPPTAWKQPAGRTPDKAPGRFAWAPDSSRSCLGCHDSSIASDGFPEVGLGVAAGGHAGNHPVDVTYTDLTARGDRTLTPRYLVDSRVQLPGNNVTCTSCHNLYSPRRALLVMSNQGSALCLSCHALP